LVVPRLASVGGPVGPWRVVAPRALPWCGWRHASRKGVSAVILVVLGAALLIIVALVILGIVVLRRIVGRVVAVTKSTVRSEEEANAHRDADEIVARAQ